MPMKMGIHHKPIGHCHSAFLDSRLRGNDGSISFSKKSFICSRFTIFFLTQNSKSKTKN